MWLLLLVVFGLIFLYRWYRQSLILENLSDKYVLITGCDTGFGNQLAKQLDKRGMKVLATCLTDHGAENLKRETSSRLQTLILDVTDSKSISSATESVSRIVGNAAIGWDFYMDFGAEFSTMENSECTPKPGLYASKKQDTRWTEKIRRPLYCELGYGLMGMTSFMSLLEYLCKHGGLWGLVNNAGYVLSFAPNEWLKREDLLKVLDVNLIGLIDTTVHLLPLVRKAQGRIVNVSSSLGRLSCIGGGYCVSKFGVEAFSDSLRRELRDFGVKVSLIEPGCFKTMMTFSVDGHSKNIRRLWNNLPTETKDSYSKQYLEQFENNLKGLLASASPRTYEVVHCMEHALSAVHPWTRYSAGWDAKLFYIPLSYIPTVLSDYLLSRSAPKRAHKDILTEQRTHKCG